MPEASPPSLEGTSFAGTADSTAYYRRLGEHRYQPTIHTQGAWNEDEQHMAPVSGLLAHEIEQHEHRGDLQVCRVTYEILGMIPARETRVETRTLRPGRTIELVEAMLLVDEQPVVRATAWRLSAQDTSAVAGGFAVPLPAPESLPGWDGAKLWDGGFIASLDFRVVPGGVPGRGRSWIHSEKDLIEGELCSPTAAFISMVDTANGHATRAHPRDWMFPNVDLTIHLFRVPRRGWVGLDTTVAFGETGLGLTASRLFDEHGQVGRAEQILTVRPIPRRRAPGAARTAGECP